MSTLALIVVLGLAMSVLALIGAVTTVMSERALARVLLPLVALAAGSLLGGAFFHMLASPGLLAGSPSGFDGPDAGEQQRSGRERKES